MRIAALCLLAAAKHAGALLIEGCADEEGFVDPWGYECADWARSGVRSSRAHLAGSFPQVGYSCYYYDDDANTELLVAGCPMTCGACECVDTEGYEDPWGYACADWVGYSCYYYSDDEKTEELVANCPASCSLCAAEEAARFPGATFVLTLPVLYDVRGKLFPNNKYATMATEDMVDAVYGNSSDGSGVYGGVARALRAFDDLKADASKAVLPLSLGAFFYKNMWWDYDGLDSARDAFERFGFGATTIGHFDFHSCGTDGSCAALGAWIDGVGANTSVLGANIDVNGVPALNGTKLRPWDVKLVNGTEVGLVGFVQSDILTISDLPDGAVPLAAPLWSQAGFDGDTENTDPDAIAYAIYELKQAHPSCDVVLLVGDQIVTSTLQTRAFSNIMRTYPEVDAVVGNFPGVGSGGESQRPASVTMFERL